jgi:hypothetical protein
VSCAIPRTVADGKQFVLISCVLLLAIIVVMFFVAELETPARAVVRQPLRVPTFLVLICAASSTIVRVVASTVTGFAQGTAPQSYNADILLALECTRLC